MSKASSTICACIALMAVPCAARATSAASSADARAEIVASTALTVLWPTALPTVRGVGTGALFVGNTPSIGLSGSNVWSKASFTVRQDTGLSSNLTAPASFTVMRSEGETALVVKTSAETGYQVEGKDVLMGGALMGGSAASIQVSALEGARGRALFVVVQYN